MRRRLFNLLAGLSLLLCVASAGIWIRSYWRHDQISIARDWFRNRTWTQYSLTTISDSGACHFLWINAWTNEDEVTWGHFSKQYGNWSCNHYTGRSSGYPTLSDEVYPGHNSLGFAFGSSEGFWHMSWRHGGQWEIIIPDWFFILLFLLLPLVWLKRKMRQHNRRKRGLCLQCGYDLRATPDRCPECGTPINNRPELGTPDLE